MASVLLFVLLLLLLLLLLGSPGGVVVFATAETINLLALGSSADTQGRFSFRNGSLSVSLNFLLAAKHFNERRADILPAFASVQECKYNLSIVNLADDASVAAKTLAIMLNYTDEIAAIVGFGTTTTATYGSVLATVLEKPLISHWATGPELANKAMFPYFSRTGSSDGMVAEKVVLFIKQMNITHFAFMYDETHRNFKQVLENLCTVHKLAVTSFSTPVSNATGVVNLGSTLETIRQLQLNVIFIHDYEKKVRNTYAPEFARAGLLTKDRVLIFDDFDREVDEQFRIPGSHVANLIAGSFYVSSTSSDTRWFEAYLRRWEQGEFSTPQGLGYLNDILPPHGNNTDYGAFGVRDSALDMQVDSDFFTKYSVPNAMVVWARAYDAVVAVGLALCSSAASSSSSSPLPPRGRELLNRIRQTKFDGMSGPVSFDNATGDRNSYNFHFHVINTNLNASPQSAIVARFNDTSQQFTFSSPLTFRAGVGAQPLTITPPPINPHYLPDGLKILALVVLALLNILCIACLVWTLVNFTHKAVLAAQREFLVLFILGCWLASWGLLPLIVDDNPDSQLSLAAALSPDTACMLSPALYCVGFVFSMLILCAKTVRLYRLYTTRGKSRKLWLAPWKPVLGVVFFTLVDAALIVVWSRVDPLQFVRVVVLRDKHDFPVITAGMCITSTQAGLAFPIALFAFNIIVLVFLAMFVQKLNGFPEEFQESRYIMFMFTSLLQLYLLCLGMFVAVSGNVIGRFMVTLLFAALSIAFQLLFLFAPKMDQVRRNLLFRKWQFSSSDSLDVSFEDVIGNVHVQEKFRAFAERNLFVESLFFYLDAEEFRVSEPDADSARDIRRAEDIYDTYIRPGAIFQVNISERCRIKVETRLKACQARLVMLTMDNKIGMLRASGGGGGGSSRWLGGRGGVTSPTAGGGGAFSSSSGNGGASSPASTAAAATNVALGEVFLPAKAEVVDLLSTGGWKAFVLSGGMYGEKAASPSGMSTKAATGAAAAAPTVIGSGVSGGTSNPSTASSSSHRRSSAMVNV